ncbi:hypothetical protein ABT168_01230 [Streptomyces sp. NPDC001793]|uniref:hypothetical protein n=1 Tax=Streptomyces sp. NPDC001793 TaxID=3154657 RepID=UPI003321CB79
MVTSIPSSRWHGMKNTRRTLFGLALVTVLLGSMPVSAVATPKDGTPIQSHIKMPLSGLLTDSGTPVNWSVLGIPL